MALETSASLRRRSLAEVRAAGDLAWFQPALDRLRTLGNEPDLPRPFFSPDGLLFIGRAPGRLDVMGGIADYSGALVLELPLACATWALVQRQDTPRCDVATRRDGKWHVFSMDVEPMLAGVLKEPEALADWIAGRDIDRWPAYPLGVIQQCLQRAARGKAVAGFRVLIDSTVPEGKGVASSAAVEVACLSAVAMSCGRDLDAPALAAECQWVENHVVGAPCGIMDQMTSACGRQDRLLRLRCQPGTIEGHIRVPAGYRFSGLDSGLRHAVTGADYGTVRTAAFMGYRIIADAAGLKFEAEGRRVRVTDPRWHGYLANLEPDEFARYEQSLPEQMTGADFLERFGGTTDDVTTVNPERRYPVRQATAHPVREQQRVEQFAALLGSLDRDPDAAKELGGLMRESHISYSACGLGSDGTDRLVAMVAELGAARGLFGAKITGGGSGGTVAVLGTDAAEGEIRGIAERYAAETGRPAALFLESGPGAAETGVLVLKLGDLPAA